MMEKTIPEFLSSQAVQGFLDELAQKHYRIHGLMVVRDGKLCYASAAEPYTLSSPHRLFSAAKSILVLPLLHAVEHGHLRVTDKVADFFPEYPAADARMADMTVFDLLTMQTGQEGDPFGALFEDFDANLLRLFFQTPLEEASGTRFRYNNTVPHLVCAVTDRAVSEPFEDYFARHFCHVMDAPVKAPTSRDGIYNPVITTMSMESFLKYALVFLNKGRHEGRQLVSPALMEEAMAEHTRTGGAADTGYGYQIWHNTFGGVRMDGGWGQIAFILPEENACAVVLSDMTDCSAVFGAFETHLLPALRKPEETESAANAIRLPSLAPAGNALPCADAMRMWKLENGIRLRVEPDGADWLLHLDDHVLRLGANGRFVPNCRVFTAFSPTIDQRVYGEDPDAMLLSCAWTSEHELVIVGKCMAEMGEYGHRIRFDEGSVSVTWHPHAVHGIALEQPGECVKGVPV